MYFIFLSFDFGHSFFMTLEILFFGLFVCQSKKVCYFAISFELDKNFFFSSSSFFKVIAWNSISLGILVEISPGTASRKLIRNG